MTCTPHLEQGGHAHVLSKPLLRDSVDCGVRSVARTLDLMYPAPAILRVSCPALLRIIRDLNVDVLSTYHCR